MPDWLSGQQRPVAVDPLIIASAGQLISCPPNPLQWPYALEEKGIRPLVMNAVPCKTDATDVTAELDLRSPFPFQWLWASRWLPVLASAVVERDCPVQSLEQWCER